MITIRRRQYEPNKWTNDIFVNGRLHVTAVGDGLVGTIVNRLQHLLGGL